MRRLLAVSLAVLALSAPAFAASDPLPTPQNGCADRATAGGDRETVQLAQSDCRGSCSSTRGYCLSSCRDSQCRAICNDRYQSCVSSCRR